MGIQQQIISCDIRYSQELDPKAKHLLQGIFKVEPNLRLTLQEIMDNKFYN
jgi:hypothetical protein